MGKRILTVSTALAVLQLTAKGLCAVPVEQIEAYNPYAIGTTLDPYAPVNFSGSSSLTVGWGALGGAFSDITFHADMATGNANTVSGHAQTVGDYFYGQYQSTAFSYVTNVYDESAQDFLTIVLDPAGATGIGPLPGSFAGGAEVINNSYVASQGSTSALLDDDRRMDYMINAADVVWVSSAVTGGTGFTVPQYLAWSNFNGLAVSGIQDSQQFFNPAGSPGKQHADISIPTTDASFASAIVSGYATALWGNAQANNQIDAEHGVVIRSLLMAGADKYSYAYTRPTNTSSGALDPINGAGQADYDSSLAILEGGEKSLLIGGAAGPIATTQSGWASGNISAGTQSVVLFQSSSPLYGLTASLNWNVTSPLAGTSSLNTAAVLFPNLTLEVRPAIYNFTSHQYVLGAPESDTTLNSAVVGDNVQYLYSTSTLLPGSYAFLIGGDPALTATVGFSYTLQGSFASKWNGSGGGGWTSPANWTNGVPNGDAAHVIIATPSGTTTPATINLNGDVTIGQLTLGNSYGDTIAQGTGGTLRIDETGDTVNNSAITVVSGNQIISAPMHFDWGLNTTIPGGASLNISGGLSGYSSGPNLVKNGTGLLLLNGTISYGGTTINAGTFTFGANTGTGFLVRTNALTVNAGAAATLAPTTVSSNRQLLISSGLTIAGGPGLWTGLLDLANNDLDVPGGNLATITNQLQQGYDAAAGGSWNGTGGIVSSSASTNPSHLTTLGVVQNNQNGSTLFNSTHLYDSTTPGASDILVKYTYYGDANLDGKVDGSDYSLIDNAYLADQSNPTALTGWYNGDFNYDGVVDGSDYTLIDNAFNTQGASLATAVSTAEIAGVSSPVPEPACAAMGFGVLSILSRRRRS